MKTTYMTSGVFCAKSLMMKLMLVVGMMVVGFGVRCETVTYTITSISAVSTSGTAPAGSNATYSSTYGTTFQLTKDNSMTLTLSGYAGYKITGITLSMRSNTSNGAGTYSMVAGSTSLSSISPAAAFNTSSWYGSWSTSYVDVTPTMNNSSYVIQSGENVVIRIAATKNSLYCQSFTITYEPGPAATYTVSYYPNGGSGSMTDNNSYAGGATVTVLANTFTAPEGMDFNGWNTAADGSGTYYDAGNTFTITENTTLYAQWITSSCRSVTFSSMGLSNGSNLNGTPIRISSAITVTFYKASGGNAPTYYTSGTSIRAYARNTFTISTSSSNITSILLTFGSGDGSNDITASTGTYSDGMWVGSASSVTFTVGGDSGHRCIASIRACTGGVILLYNANGGTGTMIDTNNPYTNGSTVTTMTNDFTAPDDMDFDGWNTAADGSGDGYAEGETFTITANTTLYAQWVTPGDGECPSITFSEQGYSDQYAEPSATFGNITISFNQGTNDNNPPKYFNNGESIRVYNGNTIAVSVSGFNVITSIRLIFGDDDGNNPVTVNEGTYNSGVWRGSESLVIFTIGYSQGKHRRIAGIRVCTAQPTSATVTYDGNGATGEVNDDNNPYDVNATVTVLGQGNLDNECNTFAGWNTAADGSGISYLPNDEFAITENITLYAQWIPAVDYTITWLANGQFISSHNFGCGSNIDVNYVPLDASIESAMCDGSKVFIGWADEVFESTDNLSSAIIKRNDFSEITVFSDKTYYAVFATRFGDYDEIWELVTNVSSLSNGDSVLIVASGFAKAIGVTQNNNNRQAVNIGKSQDGTSINLPFDHGQVCVFELQNDNVSNTWAFYDARYNNGNGGFLYAASSSSNHLKTQATLDDNGSWSISISNGVATITAQGEYTHNILRYNSGSSLFSCYVSGQEDVALYKKFGGYTYSDTTTFCPCAYEIDGLPDNALVWAGKNADADWNSTINWTQYNGGGYHLATNIPTDSDNVYIIKKSGCGITAEPVLSDNVKCNSILLNGINLNIAENQTFTINGNANFTSGIINGDVVFGENATVAGVSTDSYVDGKVTKEGAANSTDFFFPTGSNGNLGKVEVSSDVSGVTVQYYSNPAGFSDNDLPRWWASASVCGLDHVSNVEYWKIETSEPIEATFTAQASTDMHFNGATADRNPDDIQMAFYGSNCWSSIGGSADVDGNTITISDATIPASTRSISGNYIAPASKSKTTILPIELVSFTATCSGKFANLEWTTATEHNNDYFIVERSHDAVNFNEIARIAGAGNSIEPINYAYTDYGARSGDNYYRLVQVDYDGTSTASEIIVANCPAETLGEPDVLAFPNPFDDNLTLHFENFGNMQATIEVYDMLGRLVQTQKVNCSQNDYEVVLRLAGLSDGTYNVRISTKELVINRQVIKN